MQKASFFPGVIDPITYSALLFISVAVGIFWLHNQFFAVAFSLPVIVINIIFLHSTYNKIRKIYLHAKETDAFLITHNMKPMSLAHQAISRASGFLGAHLGITLTLIGIVFCTLVNITPLLVSTFALFPMIVGFGLAALLR